MIIKIISYICCAKRLNAVLYAVLGSKGIFYYFSVRFINTIKEVSKYIHPIYQLNPFVQLALIIVSCALFAFSLKKCDLKLIESTSENWHSGINGGGSGTEYHFKIKIITDKKLVFDSVWVNNKRLASFLSSSNNTISQNPVQYSKNDIVSLRVSDLSLNKAITSQPPIKYKGDALLRYYINGKIKYLIIKRIVPKQTINRP